MTISRKYNLQEVINMDQYVMRLAAYESTQGMINMPKGIDDMIEFQKETQRQFNFFKRMIQNSECTLDELEQMVLTRHGPVPNPYRNQSMGDALKKMAEEPVESESNGNEPINFMDFFMDSIRDGLPEETIMIGPTEMMSMRNGDIMMPTQKQNIKTVKPIKYEKPKDKIETENSKKAGKKTEKNRVVKKDGKPKSPKSSTDN